MKWADILDPKRGLIKDDSVIFEVHLEADEPKGVYEFDCPKQYVAAEGAVSNEHAFMMNSIFMGEQKEHGCLGDGMFEAEDLICDHVSEGEEYKRVSRRRACN